MSEFVAKTITIKKEQLEFVKAHRAINLSGVVQDALDDIISEFKNKKEKRVPAKVAPTQTPEKEIRL